MKPLHRIAFAAFAASLVSSAAGAQLADLQPGRNFTAESNWGAHP
jgi:hypothetical protein